MNDAFVMKVADFGTSAFIKGIPQRSSFPMDVAVGNNESLHLTRLVGTPLWMAPEVCEQELGVTVIAAAAAMLLLFHFHYCCCCSVN